MPRHNVLGLALICAGLGLITVLVVVYRVTAW